MKSLIRVYSLVFRIVIKVENSVFTTVYPSIPNSETSNTSNGVILTHYINSQVSGLYKEDCSLQNSQAFTEEFFILLVT